MKKMKMKKWVKESKKGQATHERRKKATNLSARKAVGKGPGPADQTTAPSYKVRDFALDAIKVDVAKRRPVNPKTVEGLVSSIKAIGLRSPLMVRVLNHVPHLVAGLQRLEAVKALGWKNVPCTAIHGGKINARKCTIAENLHRGELTKLERALQTAEWLDLTESEERISGEKVQKKGRGRPEGGDAKETCPTSRATLDMFCAMLGGFAGNVALTYGARGGVYIAGGIAPRILDYLANSEFRRRFEQKGRLHSYLEAIPSQVIVHPAATFLGLMSLGA